MKPQIHFKDVKLKAKNNVNNCPDCGSNKLIAKACKLRFPNGNVAESWFIKCKKCERVSNTFLSMSLAIEAWNNGDGYPGDIETEDDT